MTQYDNTNRGVLFVNERKQPGSRQPDYKGNVNIEGVEYWLSGWVKDSRNGQLISISVQPKDENQAPVQGGQGQARAQGPRTLSPQSSGQQRPQSNEPPMDFDDDIPF